MYRSTFALLLLASLPLAAQGTTQPDFRWEKALAAGSTVSLHNINGDVTVEPSTTGKVEIVGVRRGRGRADLTVEVVETSRGITACVVSRDVDMECGERGARVRDRRGGHDWDDHGRMDVQVRLPATLSLDAHSVSGDVRVSGTGGTVTAGSVSGNVRLDALQATGVTASTVSGDVHVAITQLAGSGPLSFSSVSGDVTVELPRGINADLAMRSVSGTLDSEFPITIDGRMSRHRLDARIGEGGRELSLRTVSGDVQLRAARPR